mgnify:CR=1 FL=1
MKHTPGPWKAYIDDKHYSYIHATRDRTEFAIAEIYVTTKKPELSANARLIAAAPDLYDAAHNLISVCLTYGVNPDHPSIVHAYNAIQKAEVK